MNTRNSSRGSKNSSFSRTRGLSASRNNISIELQDSTGAKPKVVHSPTNRSQVNRAQSSSNLSSASLFQDIVVMDNQSSTSQPQLVATSGEIPPRSSLNPNVDPFMHTSVPNSNAAVLPNTNYVNPNASNSFDSLLALMQQTMRTTQEEFRRELTSIRESISQIGSAPTSSSNRPPEMFHNFTTSQTPNSNRLSDQSRISENVNVKLEKWKISTRFKKRKYFRKLSESTVISGSDDRPFAKVKVKDDTLVGLLDSGANVYALGKDCLTFLEKNRIHYTPIKSSVRTASGNKQEVIGFCVLPIGFKGVTKNVTFYIVPSLSQQAYFGVNFWREFALAPDIISTNLGQISDISLDSSLENFHDLTPEQKLILEKTILEFPSYEKLGLGTTDVLQHHIDTGDAAPIKCKHYPLSPPRQEEAFQEIERLLKLGVIEESNSPWCSPAVLVRKPGKVRLCIDSRKLNEVTKKDSYPLPHINGLLSRLKDTYYITGIDLKDAFLQIPLTDSSKEKTAFVIPDHLTKFVFLKPMKAATTSNVILFFESEIFPTYGVPRFIHSDNAKQFLSKEMKDFYDLYGISHVTTGFYAPQSNASERANRGLFEDEVGALPI
ncbi:uncharacterized protein LOC124419231 [Lucilia cuprina]|uniref:uncharacterized protein LOC124419231 n=1 Tax=Lucilia cuprina TaxID=7375 RepID=UPI001F069234|nr:uncharacterized protein LOC124419231 [Lucilia cuprina]